MRSPDNGGGAGAAYSNPFGAQLGSDFHTAAPPGFHPPRLASGVFAAWSSPSLPLTEHLYTKTRFLSSTTRNFSAFLKANLKNCHLHLSRIFDIRIMCRRITEMVCFLLRIPIHKPRFMRKNKRILYIQFSIKKLLHCTTGYQNRIFL